MSSEVVRKREWQRAMRHRFQETHGYSTAAHYATGANREAILVRDARQCVKCGMTEAAHLEKWSRPITVDHINKNRRDNALANLQTLCLSCHGRKDQLPRLREPQVEQVKERVIALRRDRVPYQSIADQLGFSIAAIWKWCQRWEKEIV